MFTVCWLQRNGRQGLGFNFCQTPILLNDLIQKQYLKIFSTFYFSRAIFKRHNLPPKTLIYAGKRTAPFYTKTQTTGCRRTQNYQKYEMTHLSSDLVAALASLHMNDFPHVEFELFLSVGVCINLRKYFWIVVRRFSNFFSTEFCGTSPHKGFQFSNELNKGDEV